MASQGTVHLWWARPHQHVQVPHVEKQGAAIAMLHVKGPTTGTPRLGATRSMPSCLVTNFFHALGIDDEFEVMVIIM